MTKRTVSFDRSRRATKVAVRGLGGVPSNKKIPANGGPGEPRRKVPSAVRLRRARARRTLVRGKGGAHRCGDGGGRGEGSCDDGELAREDVTCGGTGRLQEIDIEGAEYEVLPHLLLTGALCLVRYLVVEWHLNALPEPQRLAGLGLRLSLPMLLRAGCRHAPPILYEDDVLDTHTNQSAAARTINNHDVVIPGLAELVRKFAPDSSAGSVFNRRRWEELHKELRTGRLKVPRQAKAVGRDEVAV